MIDRLNANNVDKIKSEELDELVYSSEEIEDRLVESNDNKETDKSPLEEKEMDLFSVINSQFQNLYPENEEVKVEVIQEDIDKIIAIAQISLPQMLKNILEDGVIYKLEIKEISKEIIFCYPSDIINIDDNYPSFKEDVPKGLIFATDLEANVYYYGSGNEGLGLYIVGAGDGNFFEEAIKFADTFEDFFIEGKGIDILKAYYHV